eukprot:c25954_g1_i2 orf=327-1235(+)
MFSSGTLRRRIFHDDVGGKRYERIDSSGSGGDLDEPLLSHDYDSPRRSLHFDEDEDDWMDKKRKEEFAWTQIFTRLLAQWVHFIATFLIGSGSWAGNVLFRAVTRQQLNEESVAIDLSPIQQERLQSLQQRVAIPFDGTCLEHQWKDMGWQGRDPSTDFRGGGFISLENLLFLAKKYPHSFQRLLHKHEGKRSEWEYPFAIAGINISFMLIQMLDLRSDKPSSLPAVNFLKMLAVDEMAFNRLFCVAFELMDAHWLAMRASYMEFNAVLKATQLQLERELSLDDAGQLEDLPAYNLLSSQCY